MIPASEKNHKQKLMEGKKKTNTQNLKRMVQVDFEKVHLNFFFLLRMKNRMYECCLEEAQIIIVY